MLRAALLAEVKNRVALFVTNMVEDATNRSFANRAAGAKSPMPQYFDIHFGVAAIFDPSLYKEGLNILSWLRLSFNQIFLVKGAEPANAP